MTNMFKAAALAGATLISTTAMAHSGTHKHRAMATNTQADQLNRQQLASLNNGTPMAMNGNPASAPMTDGSMASPAAPMAQPGEAGMTTTESPSTPATPPQ